MKNGLILFAILLGLQPINISAQEHGTSSFFNPTSIGLLIYSNDSETLWNALRFANFSKNAGDTVTIFLLGKGVELDILIKTNNDLEEQTDLFLGSGGKILGCGTCLSSRNLNEPKICKFSSMEDLYVIIRKNKKIMTF